MEAKTGDGGGRREWRRARTRQDPAETPASPRASPPRDPSGVTVVTELPFVFPKATFVGVTGAGPRRSRGAPYIRQIMSLLRSRHLFAVVLAAGLAACSDQGGVIVPPSTGGPLIPGTWYLHEANGDTLPAQISQRIVGVASETTMLDSARLLVNSDLTYEQRFWTRVLVTGTLDRVDVVIDNGTFGSEGRGFRLTSSVRAREFTMVVPSLGNLTTTEQMVFFVNSPPMTTGTYKLSRP